MRSQGRGLHGAGAGVPMTFPQPPLARCSPETAATLMPARLDGGWWRKTYRRCGVARIRLKRDSPRPRLVKSGVGDGGFVAELMDRFGPIPTTAAGGSADKIGEAYGKTRG